MKKYLFITLVALAFFAPAIGVDAQQTQPKDCTTQADGQLGYCPLEPIPGLLDGRPTTDLPILLRNLFRILFSIGALISVVMLVMGGVQYMVSGTSLVKSASKERIKSSLIALGILVGSYLLLYTINPELVNLKLLIPSTARISTAGSANTPANGAVPASACTSQSTSETVTNSYYSDAPSTCKTEIERMLALRGEMLSDRATAVVIVFKSLADLSSSRAALDIFSDNCFNDGGRSTSVGQTSKNEPIYACVRRQ